MTATCPTEAKDGGLMEANVESMILIPKIFDENKGGMLRIIAKGSTEEVMKLSAEQRTPCKRTGNKLFVLTNGVKLVGSKMSNISHQQSRRQKEGNEKCGLNCLRFGTSYIFGSNRMRSKSDPWFGRFTAEHRTTWTPIEAHEQMPFWKCP